MMLVLYSYAEYQISDTPAGNAQAEAEAIFVTPFKGVDLATVPDQDRDNVEIMRKQAEDAETQLFNPAIDAADGDEGTLLSLPTSQPALTTLGPCTADALQRGKIKNKVLKLTGLSQVRKIDVSLPVSLMFAKVAE